jgi:DNA-binding transcriptional LysR family regulator
MGSLSEAARQLDVSPSTASRHIERLEADLKQKLFIRRHDGYRLTEIGANLTEQVEIIEAKARSLERSIGVQPDELRGTVRLATPELLAHELVIPALGAFHAEYPGISLELVADVRPVRLARREADLVVRAVRPSAGEYKIRKIGRVAAALFGSPAYLEQHGEPKAPSDLAKHRLIGWDQDLEFLNVAAWLAEFAGDLRPWLRTNNYTAQYRACQAGLGLAVLPSLVGRRADLCRVLPHVPSLKVDIWLLVNLEFAQTERVRRVAGFLNAVFSDPVLSV